MSREELTAQFRHFLNEKQEQLEEIKSLYKISERYVEEMKLFNGEEIYWRFILRRAYLSLETLIRWADECLEELTGQGGGTPHEGL